MTARLGGGDLFRREHYTGLGEMFLFESHDIGFPPDDQGRIGIVDGFREKGVEFLFVAQVVVFGHNMVYHPASREGTLEHRRNPVVAIPLLVNHDSSPAEIFGVLLGNHPSSVLAHASRRVVGCDHLPEISLDRLP